MVLQIEAAVYEAMTPAVDTEWYRVPEVFLISPTATVAYYSTALDTWSCGCIFYELLGSQPMAQGRGAAEVCSCWLSVIGLPPSGVGSPLYLQGGCAGPPHRGLAHSSLPTTFALPWGMALGAACPPVGLQLAAINGGSSNRHICLWRRAACGPCSRSHRMHTCSSHIWRWPGQGRITCF